MYKQRRWLWAGLLLWCLLTPLGAKESEGTDILVPATATTQAMLRQNTFTIDTATWVVPEAKIILESKLVLDFTRTEGDRFRIRMRYSPRSGRANLPEIQIVGMVLDSIVHRVAQANGFGYWNMSSAQDLNNQHAFESFFGLMLPSPQEATLHLYHDQAFAANAPGTIFWQGRASAADTKTWEGYRSITHNAFKDAGYWSDTHAAVAPLSPTDLQKFWRQPAFLVASRSWMPVESQKKLGVNLNLNYKRIQKDQYQVIWTMTTGVPQAGGEGAVPAVGFYAVPFLYATALELAYAHGYPYMAVGLSQSSPTPKTNEMRYVVLLLKEPHIPEAMRKDWYFDGPVADVAALRMRKKQGIAYVLKQQLP